MAHATVVVEMEKEVLGEVEDAKKVNPRRRRLLTDGAVTALTTT